MEALEGRLGLGFDGGLGWVGGEEGGAGLVIGLGGAHWEDLKLAEGFERRGEVVFGCAADGDEMC